MKSNNFFVSSLCLSLETQMSSLMHMSGESPKNFEFTCQLVSSALLQCSKISNPFILSKNPVHVLNRPLPFTERFVSEWIRNIIGRISSCTESSTLDSLLSCWLNVHIYRGSIVDVRGIHLHPFFVSSPLLFFSFPV